MLMFELGAYESVATHIHLDLISIVELLWTPGNSIVECDFLCKFP